MKDALLRAMLVLDAMILLGLGAVLMLAPHMVERAFHFTDLPESAAYIIGSWGCAMATMALGYAVAARDPLRHVVWVQVGIARGALECAMGVLYVSRGLVTFQQVGYGIIVAAVMTAAYLVLYPRGSALPARAS